MFARPGIAADHAVKLARVDLYMRTALALAAL
jgi:hypothetical protein